ncbi:hypothetical protein I6E50_11655 [Roseburia hominis]|uniref:hypothetical protein n=1 Tax=Roseburia hominis TaxID=301301 RepID=UPI001F405BCF|nr:hypothetical protein [Roseburia hominis]
MDNNQNLIPLQNISDKNKIQEVFLNPQTQNYITNQAQQNSMKKLSTPQNDIPLKNPMEKTETLLEQQLEEEKNRNIELQEQLNESYIQLKQLNDKESSQNMYIKELKADLKEESLKRELAETKISVKDYKIALLSGVIGLITGLICAWISFILSTS